MPWTGIKFEPLMCPFIYQLTYMGCQLIDRHDEKNGKNKSSSDSPDF